VRGYQFKSEGPGESRRNPVAYQPLDGGKEKLAEAASLSLDADGQGLQDRGFAEKIV
jgi:queuine tRNA-ribosyltransferase accessory subunit